MDRHELELKVESLQIYTIREEGDYFVEFAFEKTLELTTKDILDLPLLEKILNSQEVLPARITFDFTPGDRYQTRPDGFDSDYENILFEIYFEGKWTSLKNIFKNKEFDECVKGYVIKHAWGALEDLIESYAEGNY